MSIYWDDRKKRWRFEFKRAVSGRRHRVTRLLPKGWNRAKADAYDQKETARLYAVASGVERGEVSVEHCVELYLKERGAELKSRKTAAEHLAAIFWAYEGRPLSELPEIARAVIASNNEAEKPLSPATTKQRLALLKAACRYAWRHHQICAADPTAAMRLPAVRKRAPVWFDRQVMLQLARATDRRDLRAAIRIGFYSGLRLGEMKACSVHPSAIVLQTSKNDEPRIVPLHPKAAAAARRYLPLTAPNSTLQRAMQRARKAIGRPEITIHKTRHSAASAMIQAGVDLYTVGKVLGHKDARSTQIYAHLAHEQLADAVGKIGQKRPHPGDQKDEGRPKAAA